MSKYHGWFGRTARRHCPHSHLLPIWGDDVRLVGGWRLQCVDCNQYLDGPVSLAELRNDSELQANEVDE